MICPNCKKTYNSHQNYCISCGTLLVPETPEEEQNVSKGVFDDVPTAEEKAAELKMFSELGVQRHFLREREEAEEEERMEQFNEDN